MRGMTPRETGGQPQPGRGRRALSATAGTARDSARMRGAASAARGLLSRAPQFQNSIPAALRILNPPILWPPVRGFEGNPAGIRLPAFCAAAPFADLGAL